MKKIMIVLLAIVCLVLVGCGKEETLDGEWKVDYDAQPLVFSDDAFETFNNAMKKLEGEELTPIVLLGTQVVSGTNYRYLCLEKNQGDPTIMESDPYSYQVVTVYKDLNGEANITDFYGVDVNEFVGQSIDTVYESLVGGWTVNHEIEGSNIDPVIVDAFTKATKDDDFTYTPMIVFARQKSDKVNGYAILALQEENQEYSFQVLSISADDKENAKLLNKAFFDVAKFTIEIDN